MRKQIAAANWKMNMTFQLGEKLLDDILGANINLATTSANDLCRTVSLPADGKK